MRPLIPCVLAAITAAGALVATSAAQLGDGPDLSPVAAAAQQRDSQAPTRARATLATGPDGSEGAVAPQCPPCGRRAISGGVSLAGVGIDDGEAIATTERRGGQTVASASAAARTVSVLDGLVTANGVRRLATTSGDGVDVSGHVRGLVVGGRRIGDVYLPEQAVALPDGLGRVTLNSGADGLRVKLERDYQSYRAGSVFRVARVRVKVSAQPNQTDDEESVPEEDRPNEEQANEEREEERTDAAKSRRRKAAEKEKRARPRTAKLKRRKAPEGVKARLTGGGFVFPVYGGGVNFSDDYGAPRQIGAHQGNDVFGPFGAPALAVTDGRIVKVGTLPISGNRLWLVTEQGDAFFYAHLSAFSPAAVNGRHVNAGEVLGFVGNTGDAEPTPPHVHFEVHPGGLAKDAVNPYPFLLAWQDGSDVPPGAWLTRYGRDTSQRPGALVEVEDYIAREGG